MDRRAALVNHISRNIEMLDSIAARIKGRRKAPQGAEADETYIGGREKNKHANKRQPIGTSPNSGKETVFALVERGGNARSFHLPDVKGGTLREIIEAHLDGKTVVHTDDSKTTRFAVRKFDGETVHHSIGEYVRGDVHTNTIESYFSILKRGIVAPITT